MPYAGIRGQRFYYEVGGEGELVLLVHGALANADLMEAPATGLASGFRAARIDRRGCGRTTPPTDGPVPLGDEADDVLAFLDWFSVPRAHFLGHDDGCDVVLEFALRHPERTGSVALLAPSLEGLPFSPEGASAAAELRAALRTDPASALEEKLFPSPVFDAAREREGVDLPPLPDEPRAAGPDPEGRGRPRRAARGRLGEDPRPRRRAGRGRSPPLRPGDRRGDPRRGARRLPRHVALPSRRGEPGSDAPPHRLLPPRARDRTVARRREGPEGKRGPHGPRFASCPPLAGRQAIDFRNSAFAFVRVSFERRSSIASSGLTEARARRSLWIFGSSSAV